MDWNNKEEVREYNKKYRENNKISLKQKKKEYYEKNKENILQKNKEYRMVNQNLLKIRDHLKYKNNLKKIKIRVREYYL
jgi:hypothetical protein